MRLPFDALAGNAGRKATPALASECAREVRKVPRVLQTQDHANARSPVSPTITTNSTNRLRI
jgi:hypothetical protein